MINRPEGVEEFDDILDNNEGVVVCFSAKSWCVPCRQFAPHFEAASEEVDNVSWVEVDLDVAENMNVAGRYGVTGVPTVIYFQNGQQKQYIMDRTAIPLIKKVQDLTD